MKGPIRHIIRRQVLDLKGVKEEDARQLQEEVRQLFWEKLLPLLERYLDAHGRPEFLRIEKLELSLGKVSRSQLETAFIEKVEEELNAQLEALSEKEREASKGREKPSQSQRQLELFRFFMETGSLPWWADGREPGRIGQAFDSLLQNTPNELQALMSKWAARPSVLKRITRQLPFPKWTGLLAIRLGKPAAETEQLLRELALALEAKQPGQFSRYKQLEILGQQLLSWAFLEAGPSLDETAFWRGALRQAADSHSVGYDELLARLTERPEGAGESTGRLWKRLQKETKLNTYRPGQEQLIARIGQLLHTGALPDHWRAVLKRLEGRALPPRELEALSRQLEEALGQLPEPSNDDFSDSEALPIYNAGLVMLWPFLPRLFGQLELVSEKRFVDEAAAHRAAGLLQFLADGQAEPAEYHCALNKVLCGLEWNAVLDFGPPARPKETEACERMLSAVLEHLEPALGKLSMAGLRGSYLLREGLLSSGAGAWRLQVEHKGYDVLLQRLPWPIGMVKLPWMAWGVGVEWEGAG